MHEAVPLLATRKRYRDSTRTHANLPGQLSFQVPMRPKTDRLATALLVSALITLTGSSGFIYVADYVTGAGNQRAISPSVKVFSPTANGNVAPVSSFTSPQWTGPGIVSIAIE